MGVKGYEALGVIQLVLKTFKTLVDLEHIK